MRGPVFEMGREQLAWEDVRRWLDRRPTLRLSAAGRRQLETGHRFLQEKLAEGHAIYGINTGFGRLCNVRIGADRLIDLQHNLLRSHAVGTGDLSDPAVVRLMLALKAHGLTNPHSGLRPAVVERLLWLHNEEILPVVPEVGSLGASGDLAPLAHLALPLIGEGAVWVEGVRRPAGAVLAERGLTPLVLGPKEGLALINGTQFMTAQAAVALERIRTLLGQFLRVAAWEVEAYDGLPSPFSPALNRLRRSRYQQEVAAAIYGWLTESPLVMAPQKAHVQDPYSFRCIPQVYGAVAETIDHFRRVWEDEVNSVTDNPHLLPAEGQVLSGGNFHGQRLAMAADFVAQGLYQLSAMAERRMYRLIGGERGLPPFLTEEPGLHSGMMIVQYTTAALVNRLRQGSFPVSNHSLPTSMGQEDHVSMGGNAVVRLHAMVDALRSQLGLQLLVVVQALRFRPAGRLSPAARQLLAAMADRVPPPSEDAPWGAVAAALTQWLADRPALLSAAPIV